MNATDITKTLGATLVTAAALLPLPASAEIEGTCSKAVGTYLTKNDLDNNGRTGTSRSLLVLTNGGHALLFDSDQAGAAMDSRPFGDSAGTWRCDGVDTDGTVRLTAATLDFAYPDAEGDAGQLARIDATGTYDPETETMELTGTLGFLPLNADAQSADALSKAPSTIAVSLTGRRIELPEAPPPKAP
ncbi:hypothetical protein AUC68_00865 [Methyloceanibacter methanicus]|uniref:Uncharacterized protein n=1 Tax=Methyloceanibacter methanicus TaxID=1774968 RepID=A0A1E3W3I4_9HYPH|nr:hypothetical protein [Methyloceanibacter methanicus]ODS00356.1 hypothetical protein AUC68_00865 [Methyloceanibacter methanicus]